ncbi:FG-GAP repeat domain-containing protein [Streptomyces zaomyceticus]|uniref:FG-GAP repeat domain-containing protein n=1 Tax=Streptomyces zaomyceticus TaxID=68286 RepID=UPI003689831A
MPRAHPSRHRLALAVTAVLAVAVSTLATVPATAAPGPEATSTATPAALEVVKESVPQHADFRTTSGDVDFSWEVNATTEVTTVRLELTHTASGQKKTFEEHTGDGRAVLRWNGLFDGFTSASNGAYTWHMTATVYGTDRSVERTGALTVDSGQGPHNFSDTGSPDILVRGNDTLYTFDSRKALQFAHVEPATPRNAGTGWAAYDRIVAPGNIGGDRFSDLVTRDTTGTLWVHPGTGSATSPFAERVRVGGGWQVYGDVTGHGDLDGDGRPDLVATDKAGDQWFYKGTGNTAAPFEPRRKTGHGWNIYNKITATGNIGGNPTADLVARDKDGVLWLYLGKGDGTFAARTRIGGGWNTFNEIVGVGDADRDGHPDLMVNGRSGRIDEDLSLYRGTGDWKVPFEKRSPIVTILSAPGWYTQLF